MRKHSIQFSIAAALLILYAGCKVASTNQQQAYSGNPLFKGWYADPEATIFNNRYFIFPTYSDKYEKQVFLDAFSSPDLVNWQKHEKVLDTNAVRWAKRAMWAPAIIEIEKKFYLFFGANDIQSNAEYGGIGVAVADKPEGPYRDHLGKPLIDKFYNGAQPIDQFVFKDADGTHYIIYGGWRHCNIARLNNDITGIVPPGRDPRNAGRRTGEPLHAPGPGVRAFDGARRRAGG